MYELTDDDGAHVVANPQQVPYTLLPQVIEPESSRATERLGSWFTRGMYSFNRVFWFYMLT